MSFDFDLFVIGAGSGGVRAARFAAGFGARVAVAESRYLGGTCVNVGCVPKKLLVYGAHFSEDFEQARAYGWSAGEAQFDWATLIGNKNREIQRLNGIYRNLLVNSGVTLLEGHARLLDAHSVEVDGQRFSAKHILVATGGWPQVPDIPGKEHAITSNEAFFLERLPRRVLVVGGGYIAVEFASIFNGLGAETTLLYRRDLFLRGFDRSVREHLRDELGKKGLDLQFNSDIARIDKQADGSLAATLKDGRVLEADCVFYATGRRPMLDDLGLENTAVKLTDKGFIAVDEHYQTSEPSILALGDVIGRVQLTPRGAGRGYGGGTAIVQAGGVSPGGLQVDSHRGVQTAQHRHRRPGRGGGAERRAQGEDLREPLPADEADPYRRPGKDPDEAGRGCPRRQGAGLPHGRRRGRRDPPGYRGGDEGRGDQAGVRRDHRHPPDRGGRVRHPAHADALSRV